MDILPSCYQFKTGIFLSAHLSNGKFIDLAFCKWKSLSIYLSILLTVQKLVHQGSRGPLSAKLQDMIPENGV